MKASALNRADLLQRQGKYPAPADSPQNIPGIEFAGVIAATGAKSKLWRAGQRIFGIAGGGAHAEFIAVHERTISEIPANLSWTEAAAIPEAFITAHDALWKQACLRPSEFVLIHAVGSGVGLGFTGPKPVNANASVPSNNPAFALDLRSFVIALSLPVGSMMDQGARLERLIGLKKASRY